MIMLWRSMADIVSPETRSRMMSGIRGKDTKPEMILRHGLHHLGFRYRLHDKKLPGKPDLVFPKYNAVLFAHGCFWHKHDCHLFRMPSTRPGFWKEKLNGNLERDHRNKIKLVALGWRIGTVWECALKGKNRKPVSDIMNHIASWLTSSEMNLELRGMA